MEEEIKIDAESIKEQAKMNSEVPVAPIQEVKQKTKKQKFQTEVSEDSLINCLSNTTVVVKHIPRANAIQDPKHALSGGLAENSTITFTVPKLRSGVYVDVLTKSEMAFLEYTLGLEPGAMNVYNKENNFWSNKNPMGISKVRLGKYDTTLHLDNAIEYIHYKILLANKDYICPNLHTLQDRPKATYQYVLISDNDISLATKGRMDTIKRCYTEYGKIEDNPKILRYIIEIIDGKPVSKNTKLDWLQTKAGELIEQDAKIFLSTITDPLMPTRLLVKECIEEGLISRKGDYLYLRSDNTPLCDAGEEPTMSMAAKYLANPRRQDIRFSLEAKLKTKN